MTAIFAYSSPTVAFIASDTLRAVPGMSLLSVSVSKSHFWSDQVVFGQSGTQFLSKLVGEIKVAKLQWTDTSTGAVQLDDSEGWLYKTFGCFQGSQYKNALAQPGGANFSNGSLLVAHAGASHGLARYDFATGSRVTLAGQVAADGTDEPAFLGIANKHLASMKAGPSGTIPLDEWGRRCLAEAISLHPTSVGWPADLLIARPDGRGGRWIVQQRISASSAFGDPIFLG